METETKLRSRLGNPVIGEDFWPRPDVVDRLFTDLVENKGSRRLFALRRIGKTSVLLELERRLRAKTGLTVIRIDVQGISRFKDFLGKVFEQIPSDSRLQQTRQKMANNSVIQSLLPAIWARITGQPVTTSLAGFQNEFDHAAAWDGDIKAALVEAGPVVLIIDELPFMMRDMMKAGYKTWDVERFLATLRDWRMNCGVRMLLSGSIGLAQLNRIDRIQVFDYVGDIFPVSLPPLAPPEATQMVEALARGEGVKDWSRPLSEAIVDASAETWPIFLQYGFEAVVRAGVRDPARVAAIVEINVRRAIDETFYEQFSTRLSRYEADEKAARIVLKTFIAAAPAPAAFQAIDDVLTKIGAIERRDDLLEALREDDFILFDTEARTVRPASKLVPIWVRARAWGR